MWLSGVNGIFLQVTTPLLFKLIPAVVHLGVLLRWFSPDSQAEVLIHPISFLHKIGTRHRPPHVCNMVVHFAELFFECDFYIQLVFKGDNLRSDSAKQRIALISKDLLIHEGWLFTGLFHILLSKKALLHHLMSKQLEDLLDWFIFSSHASFLLLYISNQSSERQSDTSLR